LGKAAITVNKNMVPFDKQSPMVTSGIRIGTAAITSRGFKTKDALQVVEWIDQLLLQPENEKLIGDIKEEVHIYMNQFPLYPAF
ncbi:MAG: serine hydroxymethyltransferase, partial [Bacteroidota bacterium]